MDDLDGLLLVDPATAGAGVALCDRAALAERDDGFARATGSTRATALVRDAADAPLDAPTDDLLLTATLALLGDLPAATAFLTEAGLGFFAPVDWSDTALRADFLRAAFATIVPHSFQVLGATHPNCGGQRLRLVQIIHHKKSDTIRQTKPVPF